MNAETSSADAAQPRRSDDGYIEACLRGERLYGDDFEEDELRSWYEDERRGYISLDSSNQGTYEYHALNRFHGFRNLEGPFGHVLGFGSAYGDEMKPIAARCERFTIVDMVPEFHRGDLFGVPTRFVAADHRGYLPIDTESVDLVVSFGALHHVAAVSRSASEFHRCLRPGGHALIREPTISLGDWRHQRAGLTKRERGIPHAMLRGILELAGFRISREARVGFPPTLKLARSLGVQPFNSRFFVAFDAAVCALPLWSQTYHPERGVHRLRPQHGFFIGDRLP